MADTSLKEIFAEAAALPPGPDRDAFLELACRERPAIRDELVALLADHARLGAFLESSPDSRLDDLTISLQPASSDTLREIAETVGGLPRVLLRETEPDDADAAVVSRPGQGGPSLGAVGRYQIFGEIARGGMGAVLRARDPDLNRDLAVKVLLDSHRESVDLVRRFVEEAQIGGQLQHPGIVPIYDVGSSDDHRPFFAMKLVRGRTLAEVLAARPAPSADLPRLIGIFEQVAQTVAYAHARGVIHRDLKPSNVMVGAFGEVQVMDWGLAKVLPRGGTAEDARAGVDAPPEAVVSTARSGGDSDLSHAGSVMGTPSYMAPEQARGEVDRVNERADVFALGSILCEILTGRPAFTGASAREILRAAARGDTSDALGRLDACQADGELIALCGECLRLEPHTRPRDARAVAERVAAYLLGVQERLRKAEIARLEERSRRRLATVAAAFVALLSLAGAGGFAWSQKARAARAASIAEGVDDSLRKADGLWREAKRLGSAESPLWGEALGAAEAADRLARQPDADAPTRERVRTLLAGLRDDRSRADADSKARAADRALLARLTEIRSDQFRLGNDRRVDAAFAGAFREAGIDLDTLDPAEAGRRIAARTAPVEIAQILDAWASLRRGLAGPEGGWRRIVAAARAADRDPWRDSLRAKFGARDPEAVATFRRLADDIAGLDSQPAVSLTLLANQLQEAKDPARAERVLRRCVSFHPEYYWGHYGLAMVRARDSGLVTEVFPDPPEAVRHLTAAAAIRPDDASTHTLLAAALWRHERYEESILSYRRAVRLDPGSARARQGLGVALTAAGRLDEAIAEMKRSTELDPEDSTTWGGLGYALQISGRTEEAIEATRRAIKLRPDDAVHHSNFCDILRTAGRLDEAVKEGREAVRLRPDVAGFRLNLGIALRLSGLRREAEAEYREAIRLDPKEARAHHSLGNVLVALGDFEGSLASYRKAAALNPAGPMAEDIKHQIARGERFLALMPRLAAVVRGDEKPRDSDEAVQSAKMAAITERFAASARIWSEALAADPKLSEDLSEGHAFEAATVAVRAGSGQGSDGAKLSDEERAAQRQTALRWLRQARLDWKKGLAAGSIPKPAGPSYLRTFVTDPGFGPVRDPGGLAKLPPAEREQWAALWRAFDELLDLYGKP